jgi:ribosomal protein S18 acetylase RimI-like enzyme
MAYGANKGEEMSDIARIQEYLRASAGQRYATVAIPPFILYFDLADSAIYFNYAIPSEPANGNLDEPLAALRREFIARARRPRFEFIAEFAPGLAAALQAHGFLEDARLHLMICSPETRVPAPDVPDLSITELSEESPEQDLYDYTLTVSQGFDPAGTELPTDDEIERTRQNLRNSRSFLGRLGQEPAGAASYTGTLDGVTEIVGIATRQQFRRRGIAGALTARVVQSAFAEGVTLACLTAADEQAGRVYERIGFRPQATMLFYVDEATTE